MRKMVTLKQFGRKRIGNMKSIILLFMRERERERERETDRYTDRLLHTMRKTTVYIEKKVNVMDANKGRG